MDTSHGYNCVRKQWQAHATMWEVSCELAPTLCTTVHEICLTGYVS